MYTHSEFTTSQQAQGQNANMESDAAIETARTATHPNTAQGRHTWTQEPHRKRTDTSRTQEIGETDHTPLWETDADTRRKDKAAHSETDANTTTRPRMKTHTTGETKTPIVTETDAETTTAEETDTTTGKDTIEDKQAAATQLNRRKDTHRHDRNNHWIQ